MPSGGDISCSLSKLQICEPNKCSFKPLNFGVICYVAIGNGDILILSPEDNTLNLTRYGGGDEETLVLINYS